MPLRVAAQAYCLFVRIRTTLLSSQSRAAVGRIINLKQSGRPNLGQAS